MTTTIRRFATGAALVALVSSFTACSKGGNGQSAGGNGAHAQGQGGGNGRASQPPIPVAVAAAKSGSIASYYKATATLTAEKEAEVLARVAGVVERMECEEGDHVSTGSMLLQIDDGEFQLRLAQAEAATAKARDRYERLQGMHEQELVSAEEFAGARNDLKSAEASEELARLTLGYSSVRAPFKGRVVGRLVDVGQNVNIGTPLFVIADFDPLLAVVNVPSKEFKKLQPNQAVELSLDSDGTRLSGRIKLVSPVIDPMSGTIKLTIEIPQYPPQVRPGDFAEVSIVTERRYERTLIPKSAAFSDRGDMIVYVAADSTAERRVVELGFQDDANAEILSGVEDGERIVVKGQRSLKHGSPIKILEQDGIPVDEPVQQAGS